MTVWTAIIDGYISVTGGYKQQKNIRVPVHSSSGSCGLNVLIFRLAIHLEKLGNLKMIRDKSVKIRKVSGNACLRVVCYWVSCAGQKYNVARC